MMRKRVYEVDLLRFIGAFMILLFHYTFRGYAADHMTAMPYPYLRCCTKYGYVGVDLFFIVSGFVVFMGTACQGSASRFLIARVVRLYPAFWVCCTTTFLATLVVGGDRYTATLHQYLINLTLLSGFVNTPLIDGAYWVVFVEMRFYFLVFIVLALRVGAHWERLLILWLAVSLLLIECDVSHLKYLKYLLMCDYSPYFIAGAMFYRIYDLGVSGSRLFATAIACGWCIRLAASTTVGMSSHYATSFSPIIVAAILASFFGVFLFVSAKRTTWLSTSKWLFLGGLTYPLYLVHQNVGFMLFNVLYPSLNVHLIMWATVVAMLLFAYAVYTVVEQKYAGRLRRLLA